MATPRFLMIMGEEAVRLRSLYPDLADTIAAAFETAVTGGISPVIGTTQALIRDADPEIYYLVNDACTCPVGRQQAVCVH
jgi:hypothetical protein